jgi:hypothetical protein
MPIRLAPGEIEHVSASILPSHAVVLGWVVVFTAPLFGAAGWMFTILLAPPCLVNRIGRKVVVTRQRVVVTRLFGKSEMPLAKIERVDTMGVAAPAAMRIEVRGTGINSLSFSPLQRTADIEAAIRDGVAAARQR